MLPLSKEKIGWLTSSCAKFSELCFSTCQKTAVQRKCLYGTSRKMTQEKGQEKWKISRSKKKIPNISRADGFWILYHGRRSKMMVATVSYSASIIEECWLPMARVPHFLTGKAPAVYTVQLFGRGSLNFLAVS